MADNTKEVASKVIQAGNHKFSDVVNFLVEYAKDYKGKKHLVAGTKHKLHKLTAERLEAKGVGKIVA